MTVWNIRGVPDELARTVKSTAAARGVTLTDLVIGTMGREMGAAESPRKKIADDSAGVVGENPACAPMGKREYGDYFPVIDTTPVEDKGKVLDELRGLVAGIKNNVMITPTMGEDGNFVEICPVCGGRGIIDGCPECGVIQESFIAGAKPCSLCGEEMVAAKGKWACGDQSCGIYGREQGRVE